MMPESRILATGTPEEVAAVKDSWTSRFLLLALKGGRSR
jgi:excinuclease UvrABC ATPase subunit